MNILLLVKDNAKKNNLCVCVYVCLVVYYPWHDLVYMYFFSFSSCPSFIPYVVFVALLIPPSFHLPLSSPLAFSLSLFYFILLFIFLSLPPPPPPPPVAQDYNDHHTLFDSFFPTVFTSFFPLFSSFFPLREASEGDAALVMTVTSPLLARESVY